MNKIWIVKCDVCGREIILNYPPRDEVHICEYCDVSIDEFYGWV